MTTARKPMNAPDPATPASGPAVGTRLDRSVGRLGPERKARPVRLEPGRGYVECEPAEATHLTLRIPGPTGLLTLPVVQGNTTRAGTGCWTWNGSIEAPTLRPSVLTQYDGADRQWRCHSWINDGAAQFLADCSHGMANTTVPLLDVDEPPNAELSGPTGSA